MLIELAAGMFVGLLVGRVAGQVEMTARRSASRHARIVAGAILSGSTQSYTLVEDLPREPDSTQVIY